MRTPGARTAVALLALAALATAAPPRPVAPRAVGALQDDAQHHLFTFHGAEALDYFGWSVSQAGDANGDLVPDLVVGAPGLYSSSPGYVQVLSGKTGLVLVELQGELPPYSLGERFGSAVTGGLGDLSGDGRDDVAVGAPYADDLAGSVRVFSARTGVQLASFAGDAPGDRLGQSLARAGDVNGDGFGDIAAGAPGGGYVRVFSGEWISAISQSQAPQSSAILLELSGAAEFGWSVAGIGDLDGDARADLVVGAPGNGPGTATVYSGASGAVLHVLGGTSAGDRFGRAVAAAGDVNQDGWPDLVVGAPASDLGGPDSGTVRVYSGAWIDSVSGGGNPPGVQVLHTLNGSPGELLGSAVTGAGDVNGDLVADFAASGLPASGAPGAVRVVSGQNGALLQLLAGGTVGELYAYALASAGDLNKDGFGDLVLGVPQEAALASGRGAARVVSGRKMALASDLHAFSLIQGGAQTLTIDAGRAFAGQLYLILGSASGTSPGIFSDAGLLPLNFDWYYSFVLSFIAGPPFHQFLGLLDASGRATAQFALPANTDPALVGLRLNHACVAIDLSIPVLSLATNAVPLSFFLEACAATSGAADCNENDVLDVCDITDGTSADCNGNGVPDECDVAAGTSPDLDLDGLPDECTSVLYVDAGASGAGDGSSWADAFNELADALAAAVPYTQVWVAAGTYLPDRGGSYVPGDQSSTFQVGERVGIYGGFAGGESALSERDWLANQCFLSGDLAQNDVGPLSDASRDENTRNVVSVPGEALRTTVVDGFFVSGGYAGLLAPCDFYDVDLKECTGGGLWTVGSPTVRHCTFSGNYGGRRGGGAFSNGHPLLVRCTFDGNGAVEGGGLFVDSGGGAEIVSCVFRNNEAVSGAGLFVLGPGTNPAVVSNSLFHGNSAQLDGGAIRCVDRGLVLSSSTVAYNDAGGLAGGISGTVTSSASLRSSILWGNLHIAGGGESAQILGGASMATFCTVQGWTGLLGGPGSGASPQFVDADGADGIFGTPDDDLRLVVGSPAIDAGATAALPADLADLDGDGNTSEPLPLDLDGDARVQDEPSTPDTGPGPPPVVDRGCYER